MLATNKNGTTLTDSIPPMRSDLEEVQTFLADSGSEHSSAVSAASRLKSRLAVLKSTSPLFQHIELSEHTMELLK